MGAWRLTAPGRGCVPIAIPIEDQYMPSGSILHKGSNLSSPYARGVESGNEATYNASENMESDVTLDSIKQRKHFCEFYTTEMSETKGAIYM